jgi:hypothetical protein
MPKLRLKAYQQLTLDIPRDYFNACYSSWIKSRSARGFPLTTEPCHGGAPGSKTFSVRSVSGDGNQCDAAADMSALEREIDELVYAV